VAYNSRGVALASLNKHEEAIASYEKALGIKPDYVEAHFNDGVSRLALGDLLAGWEKYEWRWKKKDFTSPKRAFRQPLWLGNEPLTGKTIFLHAEQGLGDAIQFVRYASLAAGKGARVLLGVAPSLAPLVEGLKSVAKVTTQPPPSEDFDLHCPLLSLPLAFGTTLNTIPADVPYLEAPPQRVSHWSKRLGPRKAPRVGLTWSGRAEHKNDHNRSIALTKLLPVVSQDLEFVSLQNEVRSEDQATLAESRRIRYFGDELLDFADTAALISLMDLVISVDTAAAHLAGALGKPVWVLLPFAPDWRWLLDREDSPWYPTARFFGSPHLATGKA
jgi:tetratricopeptide (TPR) repeat protein